MRDVLGLARTPRGLAERVARALLEADPRVTRTDDGRWVLARAVAAGDSSPALDACRFAVVDVEATGASPRHGARVIEIAVAVLDGDRPTLAFESLVDPGTPIAPVVTRLTGITDAAVRLAPPFARIADAVLDALAGAVFVAHQARFDWTLLCAELDRARGLLLAGPRLCTVRLARRLLPDVARRNLDALAHHFGFEIAGRHRAGPDALAAAQVLGRLLGIAKEQGAVTLADLTRVRSAECGMRNVNGSAQEGTTSHADSALRIPHSTLD